jgi:hypothetical protein
MTTEASQIRIKFSNVFGGSNLPITAVTVALPANNTAGIHQIQTKTLQKVTFSGKDSISIPNGALAVSDPINSQSRLSRLSQSLRILQRARPRTQSPVIPAAGQTAGGNLAIP